MDLNRLAVLATIGLCLLAVRLGQLCGPEPDLRRLQPAGYGCLSKDFRETQSLCPSFVNLETGDVRHLPLPSGEGLDRASVAPWRDARGRSQVVGVWWRQRGQGINRVTEAFGLGRFTFPDGEPLDRLPTNVLPSSPPCWLPGTRARLVFAGCDGSLYRFAFEGSGSPLVDGAACDVEPQPLRWRVAGVDPSKLLICELTRPSDSRLAASGLLMASVSYLPHDPEVRTFPLPQLWWLRLDRDGREVIAAGVLTRDGPEKRAPQLASRPDGGLTLVYMERKPSRSKWTLRVAPAAIDPATAAPQPLSEPGPILAEGCLWSMPGISADGHWITYLRQQGPSSRRIVRAPLGPEHWGRAGGELAAVSQTRKPVGWNRSANRIAREPSPDSQPAVERLQ